METPDYLNLANLIDILNTWDTNALLWFNGYHSPFFDQVMYWFSDKFIWIPVYIFFIYLLIKYYKKQSAYILIGFIILIALSDLISVHLFKNVFQRLRPCHQPALDGLVYIVKEKCGGQYGFYSSHASNHFAIATLLFLFLKGKIRNIGGILFLWASLISYSRIYLGVHYPGDVLAGAFMGSLIGIVVFYFYSIIRNKLLIKN